MQLSKVFRMAEVCDRHQGCIYNVSVETLRRQITGIAEVDCNLDPPSTVLTKEEEDRLNVYLTQMAAMGFGLSR